MKSVKLRLDYFLSLGLKLVEGDGFANGKYESTVCDIRGMNIPWKDDCNINVLSFAPRKNTGSQPVGDDVPVVVELAGVGRQEENADCFSWRIGGLNGEINEWKPDLTALIKMQIKHDAELTNKKVQEKFDNGTASSENIQQPKQGDKRRVEYLSNNSGQIEVEPVAFMFETDKEICCLDSDGLMLVVDIEEFVAWHPVVSELEVAKKKQVENDCTLLIDNGFIVNPDVLIFLQSNDRLAEITLPLEK